MTGGSTQQSQMRLPNCLTSRSEGRGQGRPQPALEVRESLRARRSEGYSCDRLGLIQLAARVRFDGGNSTRRKPVISYRKKRRRDIDEISAASECRYESHLSA
jgi:hypothetical protein